MDIKVGDIFVERNKHTTFIRIVSTTPNNNGFFRATTITFGYNHQFRNVSVNDMYDVTDVPTNKLGILIQE
jgi:hypothetical protein